MDEIMITKDISKKNWYVRHNGAPYEKVVL